MSKTGGEAHRYTIGWMYQSTSSGLVLAMTPAAAIIGNAEPSCPRPTPPKPPLTPPPPPPPPRAASSPARAAPPRATSACGLVEAATPALSPAATRDGVGARQLAAEGGRDACGRATNPSTFLTRTLGRPLAHPTPGICVDTVPSLQSLCTSATGRRGGEAIRGRTTLAATAWAAPPAIRRRRPSMFRGDRGSPQLTDFTTFEPFRLKCQGQVQVKLGRDLLNLIRGRFLAGKSKKEAFCYPCNLKPNPTSALEPVLHPSLLPPLNCRVIARRSSGEEATAEFSSQAQLRGGRPTDQLTDQQSS